MDIMSIHNTAQNAYALSGGSGGGTTTSSRTTSSGGCNQYTGDGYCDGGDCCLDYVYEDFCDECLCLE